MKNWCVKDHFTGHVFKVFLTEDEFRQFLEKNPDVVECVDCAECDDAPSICIE